MCHCEEAGTGTVDMIAICKKMGIPEPMFEQRGGQFVLTIRRKKAARREPTQSATQSATQSTDPVIRLLQALSAGEVSAGELRAKLHMKHRPTFRANYLHPALGSGYIEYSLPDKPNSRLQKYRLTKKGAAFLRNQRKE